MFRFEDNNIVFDGWERGIADAPYQGITDIRNVDITSTTGEIAVAFANASVTLPPVFNAVAYTATASTDRIALASVTGLYEGCAVVLASNTATGLTDSIVYFVRNISALTFQVSLYPNSAIVDITADGTGTLTTYQYGNQRGLTNNGSPVSYFEAPDMGGVLLSDCSNYVWLWQQGDNNGSPKNSLLFLGNIGGIGSASGNQTGVAYWNGYVCVVQQPTVVDVLKWEDFVSETGSDWIYNELYLNLSVITSVTQSVTSAFSLNSFRIQSANDNIAPTLVEHGQFFEAATATTTTSATISLEDGDILFVSGGTYNSINVNSATFNSNAMTRIGSGNTTNLYSSCFRYQASGSESGTVVVTYNATATNRVFMYAIVRGASLTNLVAGAENNPSSDSLSATLFLRYATQCILSFSYSKTPNGYIEFSSQTTELFNVIDNAVGSWAMGFYGGQSQQETLKKNVPIIVADNNILYWGSGGQYVASLQANPNFNPEQEIYIAGQVATLGVTYNLNAQALDLPANERVESLLMSSGQLFIGATSNKLYLWDTISPSFDSPIEFPEFGLSTLIPSNNTFYVLGGNMGRVYATNGASASIFKEVPDEITGTERPHFFFWDGSVGNGELYFSCQAYPNGSDTPLDTVGGVWAINANTGALRLVQRPLQGYDVLTRMVCPVGHGNSQSFLRPAGQGLLLGYTKDSNHYLEFSTSSPYINYESYVETDIVAVGTFFSQQTFQHIEYKLATPLVTGESIRISQRSNLTSAYTTIAEFTTTGLISDQASINWENCEWVQFKIELKSTVTNPSFVRLRELRLK